MVKKKFNFRQDFISACPPDSRDDRDLMMVDYIRPTRLPTVVEWSYLNLIIKDQGNTPSCVGQSGAYLKEIQEKYEHKAFLDFDGFNLYARCKKIDGYSGGGTYIRVAMKILESEGAKPKPSTSPLTAKTFKIKAYTKLQTIEDMKYALASTGPIVIGVSVYENFSQVYAKNNWTVPMPTGKKRGGHAIIITGYNDFRKAFRFTNSWGNDWGDKGSAWLTYDFIEKAMHTAWAGIDLDDPVTESYLDTSKLAKAVKKAKGQCELIELIRNLIKRR